MPIALLPSTSSSTEPSPILPSTWPSYLSPQKRQLSLQILQLTSLSITFTLAYEPSAAGGHAFSSLPPYVPTSTASSSSTPPSTAASSSFSTSSSTVSKLQASKPPGTRSSKRKKKSAKTQQQQQQATLPPHAHQQQSLFHQLSPLSSSTSHGSETLTGHNSSGSEAEDGDDGDGELTAVEGDHPSQTLHLQQRSSSTVGSSSGVNSRADLATVGTNAIATRVPHFATLLSRGLAVTVNGSPWRSVAAHVGEGEEAVVVVYGLSPGREYNIELGLVGQEESSSKPELTRTASITTLPETTTTTVSSIGSSVEHRGISATLVSTIRSRSRANSLRSRSRANSSASNRAASPSDSAASRPTSPITTPSVPALAAIATPNPTSVAPVGSTTAVSATNPSLDPSVDPTTLSADSLTQLLEAQLAASESQLSLLSTNLKSHRRNSQKTESHLKSSIAALQKTLEKNAAGDLRARQKVLALGESVKRLAGGKEEVELERKAVEVEVWGRTLEPNEDPSEIKSGNGTSDETGGLERDEREKQRIWNELKADVEKVAKERDDVVGGNEKLFSEWDGDLGALLSKLEKLSTKHERLQSQLAVLDGRLQAISKEKKDLLDGSHPILQEAANQYVQQRRLNGDQHQPSSHQYDIEQQQQQQQQPHLGMGRNGSNLGVGVGSMGGTATAAAGIRGNRPLAAVGPLGRPFAGGGGALNQLQHHNQGVHQAQQNQLRLQQQQQQQLQHQQQQQRAHLFLPHLASSASAPASGRPASLHLQQQQLHQHQHQQPSSATSQTFHTPQASPTPHASQPQPIHPSSNSTTTTPQPSPPASYRPNSYTSTNSANPAYATNIGTTSSSVPLVSRSSQSSAGPSFTDPPPSHSPPPGLRRPGMNGLHTSGGAAATAAAAMSSSTSSSTSSLSSSANSSAGVSSNPPPNPTSPSPPSGDPPVTVPNGPMRSSHGSSSAPSRSGSGNSVGATHLQNVNSQAGHSPSGMTAANQNPSFPSATSSPTSSSSYST